MGHRTRISATNYNISAGHCRVSGTAYKISKGRTLVGGTGYDINFTNLPEIGTPLNDMTWEQIRAISDAGKAAEYFSVGDTKTITINGSVGRDPNNFYNLSIDVFIIGFDHNSAVEGTNKIHFQIGKIDGVDVCLRDSWYGESTSSSGVFNMAFGFTESTPVGWSDSHMRKVVLGSDSTPDNPTANTLLSALPSDLRAVMKPVTKYSDNVGSETSNESHVTATTEYLPLLAEWEIRGTNSNSNVEEQRHQAQYDYYANGASKVKYAHDSVGTKLWWWTRSAAVNNHDRCVRISTSGGSSTVAKGYSGGVSPLFCV